MCDEHCAVIFFGEMQTKKDSRKKGKKKEIKKGRK
jgi:hypothetical protein